MNKSLRCYPRPRISSIAYALFLATVLYLTPLRRASAEEHVDFKFMWYQEDDDRIRVLSPTLLYETELSPTLSLKIDGIYNAISGASPTGAPPVPRTVVRTQRSKTVPTTSFLARAGASGTSSRPTPSGSSGSSGGGSKVSTRSIGPTSTSTDFVVPTAEVDETRIGANIELTKKLDGHTLVGSTSFSTESDYDSAAIALRDSMDFRNKNTTLTLGAAYTHDVIEGTAIDGEESKDTIDAMIGLTQVINRSTLMTVNLSLGYVTGYIGDPYKVAEVNGFLIPEKRPDNKDKQVLFVSLAHHLESMNATIEPNYRFYNDSFGISGNTVGLHWHQKFGEKLIVSPMIRYYDQTEADFYAVRFSGDPSEYSSDYRVSALTALAYGIKFVWFPRPEFSLDLAYEHYEQEGDDGVTNEGVYPTSNAISAGARLWF